LFLVILLFAVDVSAQTDTFVAADESTIPIIGDTAVVSPAGVSSFFVILRLILVLVLVAVAIYGIVFFLKRLSRNPVQRDPFLKVLASAPLGVNRFVHVVNVGTSAWLVGATDSSVSFIAEIKDKETVDAMLLEESRRDVETAKASGFANLLRRVVGSAEPNTATPKAENVRKNRERLRGL
jgi:flagellar protein FliO/FliZ